MKILFNIGVLFLCYALNAQNEYAVDKMNPALRKNADAVIRIKELIYTIETIGSATSSEKLVVTVFNENGEDDFSSFSRYYNKFYSIKKMEGAIYDSTGKKTRSLKKSDIKDYSSFDAPYEVTDTRQKYISFDKKKHPYPYTIEFIYSENIKYGMFYPNWLPIEDEHTGIEKTTFSIIKPASLTFRYKELNLKKKVSVTHNGEKDIFSWEMENIMPMEFENYMPANSLPVVFTAPNEFEVDDYTGDASSWKNIGKFYSILNLNRDVLPEDTKQKVKELITNEKDTLKKIQLLYKYMQSTTRYISIQLGIGGWQAMKAYDVALNGYGDCKALSNYMIALLKEAGIRANPVLVNAGKTNYTVQPDFPFFRFDHAIVCVPLSKDSLWLECTGQTDSPGYIGSFTGNRKALVINENGGTLVNTISYTSKNNNQNRKAVIFINADGEATATIKTLYQGLKQEYINLTLNYSDKEHQKQIITKNIKIPNFELTNFSLKETKSYLPVIEENLELKINKIFSKTGATIFITPDLLPDPLYIPISTCERISSFYLNPNYYTYSTSDTIIYNFPKEFSVEALPENTTVKSAFGEYTCTFNFNNSRLIYCRNLVLTGGIFSGTQYKDWIIFAKQVNRNDKLKAVFTLIK